MPTINTTNFRGGLNLTDPNTIADNQFEKLLNMNYDTSKRVQTRRGIRKFGKPVPDSVTLIDAAESTVGWAVSADAVGLSLGTPIRGTNSIKYDITVGTSVSDFAIVERNNYVLDLTNSSGYQSFWSFVPTGFNTNLTSYTVRLSSDVAGTFNTLANYYEWTLPVLVENTNNFITLNFSDAVVVGVPNIASIKYFGSKISYLPAYTNKVGILLDAIFSYSSLSTKPITSYLFDERDDTGLQRAICFAGTNMFLYHADATVVDGYWEVIDSGLTEFETGTTQRTRWSGDTYKNIIYMGNGFDSYRSWNDVAIAVYPLQPKCRYIKYLDDGDRMSAAGKDLDPSRFFYTDPIPADAVNLLAHSNIIGGDQFGKINGLSSLGQVFVIGKDLKKYSFDPVGDKFSPLDPDSGWFSHRSLQIVGKGILHETQRGIEILQPRYAVTGAAAMESPALTDDLRPLIEKIQPSFRNSSCSAYIQPYTNYYFTFDTTADGTPETTIVRSATVEAWSQYSYPAIFDYGIYVDDDQNSYYLAASAITGQMLEIEYGFSDNGASYLCELKTKQWDFSEPQVWKDFESVAITGLKTKGRDINVEILVDGISVYMGVITDNNITNPMSAANAIGNYPIGQYPLSGAVDPSISIPLYNYQVLLGGAQFSSGQKIQVRMFSETTSIAWTMDQMQIRYDNNVFDVFPTANLI